MKFLSLAGENGDAVVIRLEKIVSIERKVSTKRMLFRMDNTTTIDLGCADDHAWLSIWTQLKDLVSAENEA